MRLLGLAILGVSFAAIGCEKQLKAKAHGPATPAAHGEAQADHDPNSEVHEGSQAYLVAMTPVVKTPVIPQCRPQKNAPKGQLAPSFFEQMQTCDVTLPPQLESHPGEDHHSVGKVDEDGNCNLGIVGSTEVVCHYHDSYEFTTESKAADPAALEVHCIAFRLEHGKRTSQPIVLGAQVSCKPRGAEIHAAGHGSCGRHLPDLFKDKGGCDMRCCRDGTLTKANPGNGVRPSFGICASPILEVDCDEVLAGMHAHPAHRPADRVGPREIYRPAPPRRSVEESEKWQWKKRRSESKPLPVVQEVEPSW